MNRRKTKVTLREDPVTHRTDGSFDPNQLRFIDLVCGIGGFRLAFRRAGAECFFSCDWDKHSQTTYAANFLEKPHGDIHVLLSLTWSRSQTAVTSGP